MTALSAQADLLTMTSCDHLFYVVFHLTTLLLHILKLIPIKARSTAPCLLSLQINHCIE